MSAMDAVSFAAVAGAAGAAAAALGGMFSDCTGNAVGWTIRTENNHKRSRTSA